MDEAHDLGDVLQGPAVWPPTTAWPAAVHTGVRALKAMLDAWQVPPDQPLLVAVSGGTDSMALAILAAETQRTTRRSFGALVFDHQLQSVTAQVAQLAASSCTTMGLDPVVTRSLTVALKGEGLEAAARQARYDEFVRCVHQTHAAGVLTAHTANDQAEQVLLGLARGSGLRSIAGIRQERTHELTGLAPVRIGRPLLELTRQDTEDICAWADIQPFEDPMNSDQSIARIRVRKHLLPALLDPSTGLGSGVFSGLVTTARLAAEDATVLEEIARSTYHDLAEVGQEQISFPLKALQQLPPAILRRVVALAVQHFGAPQPSFERLAAIQDLVLPPVGRASSAGPIQLEGHVNLYRKKAGEEYAKLLVIPSYSRG
ncbi:MAG TPA: tRNA lysidine(34) synthetase TilS [Enteractinococcus sp.]